MRFHNHKHKCYIAAEGSFAGKYCKIPDEEESEEKPEDAKDETKDESKSKDEVDMPSQEISDEHDVILNDGTCSHSTE